jgi:hypothetical protein
MPTRFRQQLAVAIWERHGCDKQREGESVDRPMFLVKVYFEQYT